MNSYRPRKDPQGRGKIPGSPFDTVRTTGGQLENLDDLPFMVGLSKQEKSFFISLIDFSLRSSP
jgi:hypothetical protein